MYLQPCIKHDRITPCTMEDERCWRDAWVHCFSVCDVYFKQTLTHTGKHSHVQAYGTIVHLLMSAWQSVSTSVPLSRSTKNTWVIAFARVGVGLSALFNFVCEWGDVQNANITCWETQSLCVLLENHLIHVFNVRFSIAQNPISCSAPP